MNMRICFVAAPLMARSGVYNSTLEAVSHARSLGLQWEAVIGVSERAAGQPATADGVHEFRAEPGGLSGVKDLARQLHKLQAVRDADLVISMIPQTDMALARNDFPWIAYLRGLPWPARGESPPARRLIWRSMELTALRKALDVWATTPILAEETGTVVKRLVAPGLRPPAYVAGYRPSGTQFVWAARYAVDKNPDLFLRILSELQVSQGAMYGTGPLEQSLLARAPANVSIEGWASRETVWTNALAYVGTSTREAFGRSAVEAAMLGIPVVLSDRFGCAQFLFTDAQLRDECVLATSDPQAWCKTLQRLQTDPEYRRKVASHVQENAGKLTLDSAVRNISIAASDALTRS